MINRFCSQLQPLKVIAGLALILSLVTAWAQTEGLPVIEERGLKPAREILIDRFRGKVLFPVRYPLRGDDEKHLYCTFQKLTANEYEVVLGYGPDCNGGNACRIGSVYGRRVASNVKSNLRDHIAGGRRTRVRLHKGIVGYFAEATCGANCSDSTVYWRSGGWENVVGIKVGKIKNVVRLANSAIDGK